ncbi:MAG: rod shape-determining protein MreC [Gammaproteobacteria bacterium]
MPWQAPTGLIGEHAIKPLFINTPSITARFVTCAILSFLLISIDHANDHLAAVRSALSVVVYPVQVLVNAPVEAAANVADSMKSRRALLEENAQLRERNLLLSTRSQRYMALERENERLRELLDSSVVFDQQVIVADVLAIETTPAARQIVIDKGSNQGVFLGQPLLDAAGVVGQVSAVGPFSSTGLLVTDPRHALPVLINRNGLRAIAVGGDQSNQLSLSFVSTNADVKPGDLVVTSGLGRRFPAGYPVGRVTEVSLVPGDPFATVIVEPSAQVGHTREVLLVGPRPPQLDDERVSSLDP